MKIMQKKEPNCPIVHRGGQQKREDDSSVALKEKKKINLRLVYGIKW